MPECSNSTSTTPIILIDTTATSSPNATSSVLETTTGTSTSVPTSTPPIAVVPTTTPASPTVVVTPPTTPPVSNPLPTPPVVVTPQVVQPTQTSTPVNTQANSQANTKMPSWMKWGVYTGWTDTQMTTFENTIGKKPQMEMLFEHWGNDNFPLDAAHRIKDQGRTMVLFWEAIDYTRDIMSQPEYSYDAVIAGKLDTYFAQFAKDAKTYGGPVILVPYSEFNGDWYPWGTYVGNNTPEKFIAAYRHIHDIFVGVPNVKFAWAPNLEPTTSTSPKRFELAYPGDAYVDVVGIDGFNGEPGDPWMSFANLFDSALKRVSVYNKPVYIFSMGAAADSRKAAWITDMLTVQLYKYPNLAGWLWFNQNKERDWRINSDPASLKAFQDALP